MTGVGHSKDFILVSKETLLIDRFHYHFEQELPTKKPAQNVVTVRTITQILCPLQNLFFNVRSKPETKFTTAVAAKNEYSYSVNFRVLQ